MNGECRGRCYMPRPLPTPNVIRPVCFCIADSGQSPIPKTSPFISLFRQGKGEKKDYDDLAIKHFRLSPSLPQCASREIAPRRRVPEGFAPPRTRIPRRGINRDYLHHTVGKSKTNESQNRQEASE